jgi:GntR family transcriptional repressor for pyruvate dehydrogenase complex
MAITFKPIQVPRAFEQVCSQIRSDLASGHLKPGDKLPAEREMATQFRVSRGAVREALRTLENAGLLVIGRDGTRVSTGAPELITQSLHDMVLLGRISIMELLRVRTILLTQATRLACEEGLDEDFDRLDENIRKIESLLEGTKYDERREAALDFYRIVVECAKNAALSLLVESINKVMRQFLTTATRGTAYNLIGFRRNILNLLRARNSDAAAREMQDYLQAFHVGLTGSLDAIGDSERSGFERLPVELSNH